MQDNNPQTRLRWFAVRCDNARAVPKVAADLKRLGVNTFVPMAYRQERRGKWLVAVEDGLLFPPYLFIAMRAPGPWKSQASVMWGAVCDVTGVDRVMGCRDRSGDLVPIAIPYREMRRLRTAHRAGERRKEEARFKPGQKVRVVSGPFTGFEGVFDQPAKERVKILLSIFGGERAIELGEEEVRAA